MAPDRHFLARLAPADPVPDADLLGRFAAGDGPAFELLVRRHAGLVWRACRAVLPADRHAAEDAFQAAFLALARHPRRVRRASAAGWLAAVARHAALRRRKLLARAPGPLPADLPAPAPPDPAEAAEAAGLVLAEVGRLPARLREPVLLCLVEGCSHAEAAARLRLPVGTVASRVSRARATLRGRLARRGLAPAAVTVAAAAPAAVVRGGVAAGLAPSTASPVVTTLAAGAVSAMSVTLRLKLAAGLVLAAGAVTLPLAAGPGTADPPTVPAAKPAPAADDLAKLQGKWKVVSITVSGKKSTPADVAGMSWTFGRDAITASDGPGGKTGRMPYTLDAGKSPGRIDVTMPAADGKTATAAGIYRLAGDRLTLAMRDPQPAKRLGRPTEFAVDGETGVIELARAGTDPPAEKPLPPPRPAAPAADELAKLQGKWRVARRKFGDQDHAPVDATLTIAGDTATPAPVPDGLRETFTLSLDPAASPKRIELTHRLERVPAPGEKGSPNPGTVFRGIYKLDGDTLTWCLRTTEGVERFGRPTEFAVGGGAGVTEFVRADGPAALLAELQGDWALLSANVNGKPYRDAPKSLQGVRFREGLIWHLGPPVARGTGEWGPLQVRLPAAGEIDYVHLDRPMGRVLRGRFEVVGDRLTTTFPMTSVARPADLKPGPDREVFVFERAKPPGAKLVGEWQRPVRAAAPDDTLLVWTFRDTGVFRLDFLDRATGRVNVGPFADGLRVGRWRLDGAELVLETEGWAGDRRVPHRTVERLPVEAVTADTLTVRRLPDPRGAKWVTEAFTRFPGWGQWTKP